MARRRRRGVRGMIRAEDVQADISHPHALPVPLISLPLFLSFPHERGNERKTEKASL